MSAAYDKAEEGRSEILMLNEIPGYMPFDMIDTDERFILGPGYSLCSI